MIGERWGVTDAEVARRYPCDDVVPAPAIELWRGVTVDAAPAEVWPWLGQLRLAPYSYDWVDNLGRRSPRELRGLPEPQVGEHFSTAAHRPVGRIVAVEHERALTATILGSVMSYVLVPEQAATRLLLKIVVARRSWLGPLLAAGDWPMARKQLLTLKVLAQSSPAAAKARA